ncbi:T9SS type B sorting domain-containing protein [Flavobacterium litorale]|uniref:Gliding motility-associated C-terminal domain-containing protein n=1 Tax=Flavobacterium litorale TaxID=2856519 RepID=A0ABX8V3Y8_9FLAO|nr:gliding motility-associated C-terminal domain-containing protein [Flavobacterium litorale]QYJ67482.1 gliding motility-associated C-terminal domain-containing protein [Flavobacterium litorale]
MKKKLPYLLLLLFVAYLGYAQDIALYEQFNGRYDFTFVGNTLNPAENNPEPTCTIFTSSSADLNLGANDQVVAAYLYWAGSGTGDFDIELNGNPVTASRDFPLSALNTDGLTRDYFSAFADVTTQVQTTGNGTYTVSELDLTAEVADPLYCNIKTNFGGWAIIVFYFNPDLPLNQINLYDGMQYVPSFINISLPSLNVIDNEGAKIGFLAWEGDASLAVNETLSINGNPLSNDLNPVNNAFNGTNTVTGATDMYNMDLDIYDIQDNIAIGDETAEITLESGQDFVMVNAIVTKLNSQLPDATISIDNIARECNSGAVVLDYTVFNVNSTEVLPADTPIAFYIEGNYIGGTTTVAEIPIGGNESGTFVLNIPAGTPIEYEILVVVDDVGDGTGGIVTETDETNNSIILNEIQYVSPPLEQPDDLIECDTGAGFGVFDISVYEAELPNEDTDSITFYTSEANANVPENAIPSADLVSFQATENPQEIFVRLENEQGCVSITSFLLVTDDCLYPDGTIVINTIEKTCDSRVITISYTVNNFNSDDFLPAGTPIAIYNNGVFIGTGATTQDIPIGGTENGTVNVTVPGTLLDINITIAIDDIGDGTGEVIETDETNNNSEVVTDTLWVSPEITEELDDITECETDNGTNIGIFDFSGYIALLQQNATDVVTFHTNQDDANSGENDIDTPDNYTSSGDNPQTIYVRLEDENGCFDTTTFDLIAVDCLFPDGTVVINDIIKTCDSRSVNVQYTINNFNSFDVLPAGTPIGIYLNGVMVIFTSTIQEIPIGGSLNSNINVSIPNSAGLNFEITIIIDDLGDGTGEVTETDETNNSFTVNDTLWISPTFPLQPEDITVCETENNSNIGVFDFSEYETLLQNAATDIITFHTSQEDADDDVDNIENPDNYTSSGDNPQTIYVRLEDENGCYVTTTFNLIAEDCLFPDGIIAVENTIKSCDSRTITIDYIVGNPDSFDVLPANTPIAIYSNGVLLTTTTTTADIAINGTEAGTINVTIPNNIPLNFDITLAIDDTGNGSGIVTETNEDNNTDIFNDTLWVSPVLQQPEDLTACETDNGSNSGIFDFSGYEESLKNNSTDIVRFYTTQEDAITGEDAITNLSAYPSTSNNQTIYVRLEDENGCFTTGQFNLIAIDCLFPDGTVSIGDIAKSCNSRIINVAYTINNFDAFDVLPSGTPVAIYANDEFIDFTETLLDIPIGGTEGSIITLTIPDEIPLTFNLSFVVDDMGDGTGIVQEMNEDNNNTTVTFSLIVSPEVPQPQEVTACNEGFDIGTFDFSEYEETLKTNPNDVVYFYHTATDANQDSNRISNTNAFKNTSNPQEIFVRVANGECYATTSFLLRAIKCPPTTFNYVTPNNDGYNDRFFVEGLRNIFLNFKMSIYNRWGSLVWTGNHSTEDWDGIADVEKVGPQDNTVPVGTYYFVLELNDPEYPEPIVGWVYVTK